MNDDNNVEQQTAATKHPENQNRWCGKIKDKCHNQFSIDLFTDIVLNILGIFGGEFVKWSKCDKNGYNDNGSIFVFIYRL